MKEAGKPKPPLGRLESVDVRKYWEHEALEFTPWLAQDENLQLLGETIGLPLELVDKEKAVGPFSADILCKRQGSDEWVIIENQLEKTDHTHLGQIITYAAGLQAGTVIWVASGFTDEHRAALDWLNERTNRNTRFVGVTVELWQIGNSVPAPRFNVVSMPNDWSKGVIVPPDLTSGQVAWQRYWTAFRETIEADPGPLKPPAPSTGSWVSFAVGKSNVMIAAAGHQSAKWIRVELYLGGQAAKSRLAELRCHKAEVERELGELEWQEMKQDCRIAVRRNDCDPTEEAAWPDQHRWIIEKAKAFHTVFAPLVKDLKS